MAISLACKSEEEDIKMKIEDVDIKLGLDTYRLPKTEDNDVKPMFLKAESEGVVKVEKAEPVDVVIFEMLPACEDSEQERMLEPDDVDDDEQFRRCTTAGPSCLDDAHSATPKEHGRGAPSTPPRQRRLVFEAVQVPRLEDVLKSYRTQTALPDNQEEVKEVKKAKIKKSNMEWNFDTVTRRLDTIGHELYPIGLPDDIKQACFSRSFLCSLYGGNKRKTFPFDTKEDDDLVRGVPKNEFMYPNLIYNPHLPLIPGAPGLYSQANYPAGAGPDEWKEQDVIVRRTWARKIFDKGWGRPLRASITLRKRLGREPTHQEQGEALATDNTFQSNITPADIAAAFDRGEQLVLRRQLFQMLGEISE
ncbi:hypothetical protein EYR38_004955 [Pleurotus pulmonarius]|nr:hypothetical protein EYR38_004955 [Pleurotus pulmonarius]